MALHQFDPNGAHCRKFGGGGVASRRAGVRPVIAHHGAQLAQGEIRFFSQVDEEPRRRVDLIMANFAQQGWRDLEPIRQLAIVLDVEDALQRVDELGRVVVGVGMRPR